MFVMRCFEIITTIINRAVFNWVSLICVYLSFALLFPGTFATNQKKPTSFPIVTCSRVFRVTPFTLPRPQESLLVWARCAWGCETVAWSVLRLLTIKPRAPFFPARNGAWGRGSHLNVFDFLLSFDWLIVFSASALVLALQHSFENRSNYVKFGFNAYFAQGEATLF